MRATLLLLVLLAPLALAQEQPAQPASFVVYRPWPDAADPLATPLAPPPFDAARLPATRVDRAAAASAAPENRPESAPAHYREMLRLVQLAEAEGARVALRVEGEAAPGVLTVRVAGRPLGDAAPGSVELSIVLVEHGVAFAGRAEPYVARFAVEPRPLALPGDASVEVRLDPAWDLERLAVVAIAAREGRVLQSATWLARQLAPTDQVAKAALVEHVTASWCAACRPADEAFLLLATQRGAAGALGAQDDVSYLRAPDGWLWTGLALGGVAALVLVGRRRA